MTKFGECVVNILGCCVSSQYKLNVKKFSAVFSCYCCCTCNRLEGKSQIVEDELVRLGEQRVNTSEGTRAIALELCREFEDRFLQHINTGEVCTICDSQCLCLPFLRDFVSQHLPWGVR